MSHEALTYAKKLVTAPDGSKLKSAEKSVLMVLADSYNEEVGCAWPKMKTMADSCCISDRYCRQLIQGLERKQVLRRVFYRRAQDGSQTTNEYIFLALEKPIPAATLVEARRKFQHIHRIRISGESRPLIPSPLEGRDRGSRTKAAAPPGTQVPPIDQLGKPLIDSALKALIGTFPHIPQNVARTVNGAKTVPDESTKKAFCDAGLACTAWNAVIQDLRKGLLGVSPSTLEKRPGFTNGSKDWQSFRFNEVAVESAEVDARGGVVLNLSSPNPETTARGLEKYQKRIALALSKFYGCNATLRLQSRK